MLSPHTSLEQRDPNSREDSRDACNSVSDLRTPNLIVIGAMKASTTTFYELINRHPEIWFSAEKEPHYFTSSDYGKASAWTGYLRLFESAPKTAKYIGEASTGYSKLPHFGNTPQRLKDDLRDLRLIYLVRDPVERTVSNFQHAYLSGHYVAGTTLAEAIEKDPILIDASCYARQISAYRDVFGAEKLLTILTDELHRQTTDVMRTVEHFLEVSSYDDWDAPLPQSNSRQSLGRSLALQSILPKSMVDAARRVMPSGFRDRIKSVASPKIEVPTITESERQLVFDRVADDLLELRGLLGESIDVWPSTQRLGER